MQPDGVAEPFCQPIPRQSLRLGVLDICSVSPGQTDQESLFETFALAVQAETFGYSRYWLAEHHGATVAHSCPELLVGLVAQMTERLRVGTAGILLKYYSPLKVAKNFRLLQALFPGRLDLGVGAGRVDEETAQELLGGPIPPQLHHEGYEAKVSGLLTHLYDPHVSPCGVGSPEVWLLGSSGVGSASLAARYGTAFSLALFLRGSQDGHDDPTAVRKYRADFQPSRTLAAPRWNIAVAGVCAATAAEARRLRELHTNPFLVPTVVGSPSQCRAQLLRLQARFETDEIIFLDICPDLDHRLRSYQLLAEVLEL
jgi:luciferase family oxidoreductase group 1